MDVKEQILHNIQNVLEEITDKKPYVKIDRPQDLSHGDYSTNVALVVFPKLKDKFKNPLELAAFIAQNLQKKLPNIDRIEALKPGFINFWVSEKDLLEELDHISTLKDNFGKDEGLKSQKIMLEFAHPNTHKLFHIGHLRNITIGESLSRLLEFQGSNVYRVNYQGDVGLHVAKALYGLTEKDVENIKYQSINERIKFLSIAYIEGNKAYEENEKAKIKINEINKKVYEEDKKIMDLWHTTRDWSLEYFEKIYKRVGTKFDRLYFESEVAAPGKKIVLDNLDKVFAKDQGAIIFKGEEYGFHSRVFINSLGLPTYEAKDVGLAYLQMEDFSPDKIIHVVGPEQKGYFEVLFKALETISNKFENKEIHLEYGFVRLKEGKMSSRLGDVVEGEWLLEEAKKRIQAEFKDMDEQTLEKVAVGAVKYSMLKFSRKSDITFSFDESISLEGNSGPYLQYTFARTQSVLAKVKTRAAGKASGDARQNSKVKTTSQNLKLEIEEISILRSLIHFPEVIEEAAENFSPNLLCNYLFELSQVFNNFYQKHKILGSEKEEFRLKLTLAVGQILKTGLYLLGIESPEKM